MEVSETSRVHECPTESSLCHTAVVADKTTPTTLLREGERGGEREREREEREREREREREMVLT